jgi:DNA-binding PadR family transcriptional regulator
MKRRNSGSRREQDATWKVAVKILRYLAEHPNAADTSDGILEWWLFKQSIFDEERVVEQALDRLVEQNLIFKVEAADTRKHYHLNAERVEETRTLIHEAQNDES